MSQLLEVDLHDRLADLQRAERRRRWGTGLSLSVLAVLALAAGAVWLDYRWELSAVWRGIGLLLVLAAGVWLLREARRRARYAAADAAADAEAAHPRYGQRLRTTLDYADRPLEVAPAAPSLLLALESETRQIAATDDFAQTGSPHRFYLALGGVLVAVLICGSALVAGPELRIAAGRLLLLPWEYTTVAVEPVPSPIRQGADAVIDARVLGRPLAAATVRYRPAESQEAWQELPLLPAGVDPEQQPVTIAGAVSATIPDCQHDLEVQVVAGPREHPLQQIKVLQPLELVSFAAQVQPPAYTGRAAEDLTNQSFTVWEGSRVRLQFELNRPASRAVLEFEAAASGEAAGAGTARELSSPDDSAAPAKLSPASGSAGSPPTQPQLTIRDNLATVELPDVRHSARFTLEATAADGITLESPRFHLRVQLDRPPEIRFTSPEEQLEVIPTTEVPLAIEASDDLNLARVGVLYQVGQQPPQTLWEQVYAETAQAAVHAENTLFLEDHPLTFRDAVTYYAFAEDNYFGRPRRTTTELRFIDIRPFKREYQILHAPGGT